MKEFPSEIYIKVFKSCAVILFLERRKRHPIHSNTLNASAFNSLNLLPQPLHLLHRSLIVIEILFTAATLRFRFFRPLILELCFCDEGV